MRKNVYGRQLKRDTNERKALFKGLLSSLVLEERIKTTEQKAKAIRRDADKLITKAKKGGILAQRLLEQNLTPVAIAKVLNEIAPRFADRNGGYTRIIRLQRRFTDNAEMVIMEWVVKNEKLKVKSEKLGKDESTEDLIEFESDTKQEKKTKAKEKTVKPKRTPRKKAEEK